MSATINKEAQHIGNSFSRTTMKDKKKLIFFFFPIMFAKILQQNICNCSKINECSTFGKMCFFETSCLNAKNAKMQSTHYIWKKRIFEITYCWQTSEISLVYRNVILSITCYIICRSNKIVQEHFLGRFA